MDKNMDTELQLDGAVLRFALTMQFKLDKNKDKSCSEMNPDGKGRTWKHCKLHWLLRRLREETLELEKALDKCWDATGHMGNESDRKNVMFEASDVGNFAMMIHDAVS